MEREGYLPAVEYDRFMCRGFVHVEPDCVILAEWSAPGTLLVWLAVGPRKLQRFCDIAPPGLEFVAFARGLRGQNVPRVYRFSRLYRLCSMNFSPVPLLADEPSTSSE